MRVNMGITGQFESKAKNLAEYPPSCPDGKDDLDRTNNTPGGLSRNPAQYPARLTYGSVFAGIGGFDLGFASAGLRCAFQIEIDADCNRVLERHYPGVLRFADVRECGKHNLPSVDVICFGSPCQDLSVAGKRAGLGGERSGLFYEAMRIVRELSPALVVFENVPGLLSSNGGRDFLAVLRCFR